MKKIATGTNFAQYKLGDVEVFALRDGFIDMPTSRLRQPGDRPFERLPKEVEVVDGQLRISVNSYLIIDSGEHILIDTGASNSWDPTMGELPKALAEAGHSPGDITTIALTHTHEDHAHGLVGTQNESFYPNLERLFVPREELQLFDGIERVSRFREVRQAIDDGFQLSPHVAARAAPGHELGHTVYEVTSKGETLLIWGDTVHVQSIQFKEPELTWEFDVDQDMARASRLALLRRAVQPGTYIAGAHLDSPGVGKVTTDGARFSFSPF